MTTTPAEPAPAPARPPVALPAGPWVGFAAVLVLFSTLIGFQGELGKFLDLGNLRVLLHENTIPAVIGLGMLMVLISGGIDLSVGAVAALVTVVTMRVYAAAYDAGGAATSLLAVAAGVAAGGLCGLANGLLVTQLKLPPFVATLGMFGIARGAATWLAGRKVLSFPLGGAPRWTEDFGSAVNEFTNPGLWSLVALAALTAVLLRYTVFGRHLYAVGSNEATARLCGVNVTRTKVTVYALAGLLTGWAGVIMFAHSNSGNPTLGEQLELDVITAVVIGGASLLGGKGTVVGAMLGIAILGLIKNGVSLFDVPVEMQYLLIGVLLLANVSLNQWRQGRGR
jgi:ribose transport system permease protein